MRLIPVAVVFLSSLSAAGQSVAVRPLILTGDPLPDGSTLIGISVQPVIEGSTAAFLADTSLGKAIVRMNVDTGEITIIASEATPSPTHIGSSFDDFRPPSLHGSTVVFSAGSDQATGIDTFGIYSSDGSGISVVIDANTVPLLFPLRTYTDGTSVLFKRTGAGDPLFVVPLAGGAMQTLAARSMPTPEGGELIDIYRGVIRDGLGAYAARVSGTVPGVNNAVFRFNPPSAEIETIARTGDPLPGFPGQTYTSLFVDDTAHGAILFGGGDTSFPLSNGVLCLQTGDTCTVIADTNSPLPGVPGRTFDSVGGSTDGHDVLILGSSWSEGPEILGTYWSRAGEIYPVLSTLDTLEGLPVKFVDFENQAIDGDKAILAVTLGEFVKAGYYLAEFHPSCPADTNGDGLVSGADFSAWVAAFNAQAPACDQNGDGMCSGADFSAWVTNFNAGCP